MDTTDSPYSTTGQGPTPGCSTAPMHMDHPWLQTIHLLTPKTQSYSLLVHPIKYLELHQEIKEACTYCTTKRALHRTTKSPFSQSIPPSEESMCMHPSLSIILIMSVVKSSGSQPGSLLHIHNHILLLFPLRIADHKSTGTCIEKIQWQHTVGTDFQRKQLGNKQKCNLRTTALSTAD